MAEGTDKTDDAVKTDREEIFSRAVRAGKRTYFFDVKATRRNDYYLTLTESKKRFNRDGRFYFEKHKIFLYKEDFDKFTDGLAEVIEFIKNANPELIPLPDDAEDDIASAKEAVDEVKDNAADNAPDADETAKASGKQEEAENGPDKEEKEEKTVKDAKVKVEVEETISNNYTSDVEFEDLEDTKDT
jgi:hypothetical protein